jgi:hypothetical protein
MADSKYAYHPPDQNTAYEDEQAIRSGQASGQIKSIMKKLGSTAPEDAGTDEDPIAGRGS